MEKQIIFVTSQCSVFYQQHQDVVTYGYYETEVAIESQENAFIITTQMGLLHPRLFELNYRIFVTDLDDKLVEIKLGENTSTPRDIRAGHHLFKLWQAGEFHNCIW